VMPGNWAGFRVTRRFRGATYRIAVKRAGPGNRVALRVDGVAVAGTVIPAREEGGEVEIEATVS